MTSPTLVQSKQGARIRFPRFSLSLYLAFLVILVIAAWVLLPWLFTSHNPDVGIPTDKLQPPSSHYWFGTDQIGRDIYSRVVYGTASSVFTAFIAVAIGAIVGGLIGLVSGFSKSWGDIVLSRLVDVLLSIPSFLLAIIIVTSLGFDSVNAAIATGISSVGIFARVVRADVLRIRQMTYIEAAFLQGGSRGYILFRHVLPNASRALIPLITLRFGLSILVIAGLAFLGYGDPPPASDWGTLIATGRDYISWPWLVYAPAIVIVATVLSINRISRWLRTVM